MRDARPGLSGLTSAELEAWLSARGHPAYRARQVADAVWRSGASTVDEVLTLPAALRDELSAAFRFDTVADTDRRLSDGGLTEEGLPRLSDGALRQGRLIAYPA